MLIHCLLQLFSIAYFCPILVFAEMVWDPLSTAETVRFVNLMQKLQRDYPTVNGGAKNTQVGLSASFGTVIIILF